MSRELFNTAGKRLYLTDSERKKFRHRRRRGPPGPLLLLVLAHTGCRISEALQLHAELIDFAAQAITFESLKKRKRGVCRAGAEKRLDGVLMRSERGRAELRGILGDKIRLKPDEQGRRFLWTDYSLGILPLMPPTFANADLMVAGACSRSE